jgi:carbon-monoxide dehydrogenase medium subunit
VIPTEFEYEAPETVEDAIRLLGENQDETKVLAGGHSLLPMMKLRFAAPALLVDLRKIRGLRGIELRDDHFRIGALTTHAEVARRSDLGVAARAAGLIADQQVRNRGTIGGSLAHGDPASDMPTVLLTADGSVVARGSGGERQISAAELFLDYLTTALEPDELITHVQLPNLAGFGWCYEKFARRAEDWAIVGVCALVAATRDGACADVRVGLTNMGATPLRASAVEEALLNRPLNTDEIARAAREVAAGTNPPSELHATPDYKRHLALVLTRRALERAADAARESPVETVPRRHAPTTRRGESSTAPRAPRPRSDRPTGAPGMKIEQSFDVSAPVERVWSSLIDLEGIAPCLPGAEITGREDGVYQGTFRVKLGPTTASYRGTVELESADEAAHTVTMRASGQDSRGQGTASATIVARLSESQDGTHVEVETAYAITGKLARFGRSGMIQEVAGQLMGEFANCVERRLTGAEPAGVAARATQPVGGASLVMAVALRRVRRLLARLRRRDR